jgi:Fe-S-cluster containining protein
MVFRPKLREEVALQLHEASDTFALSDTLYGRRVAIDRLAAAMVAHFNGENTLESVLDAFVSPERPRKLLENIVRTLLFLDVFADSDSEPVRRARALRDTPHGSTDTLVLPELRFACEGSGDCCRTYTLGPLTDEDCARLDALDLAGAFPELAGGPAYEVRLLPGRGVRGRVLRSAAGGGCIFLRDDHRCGIHVRFGEEAKPHLCRIYPFELTARVDGVRIYDRGGCSRFATTSQKGPPVAQEEHRLVQLRARPAPLEHPIVAWNDRISTDFGYLIPWIDASVAAIRQDTAPWDALRSITHRALAIAEELPSCALTPRGPAAVVAEVLARPARAFTATPSLERVTAGLDVLSRLLDALATTAATLLDTPQEGSPSYLPGMLTEFHSVVLQAKTLVLAAHPNGQPLPDASLALTVRADLESIRAPLRSSLRQFVFGRGALVANDLLAGLLHACLVQLLATSSGRYRASHDGRTELLPDDLNHGHKLAQRVLSLPAMTQVLMTWKTSVGPSVDALSFLMAR